MLEGHIEKKRRKMVYLAKVYGFTSPKTVKCSQELDKLLNIHRKLKHNSKNEVESATSFMDMTTF